jgi:hypothetical protein
MGGGCFFDIDLQRAPGAQQNLAQRMSCRKK